MRTPLFAVAALLATTGLPATELQKEPAQVDGKSVPLTNKTELTLGARKDEQVRTRELWYRARSRQGWADWEKHPLDFGRNTPINWQPPEGHWQVFIRIVEVSGSADPIPSAQTEPDVEFIADRTGPKAAIQQPISGTILSTGQPYTIQWQVDDPNLHSTPVSLSWARDKLAEPQVIASGLPNSGSHKWTTPLDMSQEGRLILTAHDKVLNSSTIESVDIIVDGAPPQRAILGPTTSQHREVPVQVRVSDAGPARRVASVQLWYSSDDGANWTPGPKVSGESIESITWNAPNDGLYGLALIATDVAGNSNPVPVGPADKQFDIIVDTAAPVIGLSTPIGISDLKESAGGSPRRVYKPGDQVLVEFSLDDLSLADNPVAVSFQAGPSAPWEVLGQGMPADKAFVFKMPDVNSTQCRVKVNAIDTAGNVGEVIAPEPFTIDNKVERVQVQVEL